MPSRPFAFSESSASATITNRLEQMLDLFPDFFSSGLHSVLNVNPNDARNIGW
jgi:hypothetical protein